MTSKWSWKEPHIYIKITPRITNFTPFHCMASHHRVTDHFETNAPNDPKYPWTVIGQRYHIYIRNNYPRVPNFTPFRSKVSRFPVTGYFETSAPNDPKITLITNRSKVPHIHITITRKSQSLFFIDRVCPNFSNLCQLALIILIKKLTRKTANKLSLSFYDIHIKGIIKYCQIYVYHANLWPTLNLSDFDYFNVT